MQNRAYSKAGDPAQQAQAQKLLQTVESIKGIMAGGDPTRVGQAYAATSGKMPFGNGRDPGMILNGLTGNLSVANPELHRADLGQRQADIGRKNASAYNSRQQGRNAGSGWSQVVDTDNGYDVVDKRTGNSRTVTNNGVAVKAVPKGRAGRSKGGQQAVSSGAITYDEARAVALEQVKKDAIPWNRADNILRNSFGKGFDK